MTDEFGELWYRLVITTGLIILASVLFAWLVRKSKFSAMRPAWQQLIIGLTFGALAVLATEYGIPVGGATVNVRDAAPLAAGMLFGGPAGIIAGIIGGVERWMAAAWGAGMYTRLVSALVTVASGCVGALLHRMLFRHQKPTWWYALSVALCIEVVHMLLIFISNIQDLEVAYGFVERCTLPMVAANCVAVMVSSMFVRRMDGPRDTTQRETLEYVLQRSLFFSVLVAMIVSALFIWILQSSLIIEKTRSLLEVHLNDAPRGVQAALDAGLVGYAEWLAAAMTAEGGETMSEHTALLHDTVEEAYVIDPGSGEILMSTDPALVGSAVPADWQEGFSYATGTVGYTTPYGKSYVDDDEVKYAMIFLPDGRALIIGFKSEFVKEELGRHIQFEAEDRHVGQTGYVMMVDEDGHVDSSNGELRGTLRELGFTLDGPPHTVLRNTQGDDLVYYMYDTMDNRSGSSYIVVAALPEDEASLVSNVAMYVTIFMEIVVLAVLFIKLSSLIRQEMVRRLEAVNASLAILTDGNLDEVVNVRSTREFAKLSDGINATVAALKRYSAEMQQRLERELEFARTIQRAALPSVFPPFPARKDFEIYASMDAAKVVGGDFYDFYLLNDHTLAFLIADVSGKGVPAAMFMMRAKTQIKDLIESGIDVAEVFSRTNKALDENNTANMFVTAWMGVLDLSTGLLRYVNAGHTPPLLRKYGGDFQYMKTEADFVLGGLSNATYEAGEVVLEPGDTIFIYTDGVTEAENRESEQYGEARLLRVLQKNAEKGLNVLCHNVMIDVEQFAGPAEQFDDITMLAVRVNALMTRSSIELRPIVSSTAALMSFAARRLEDLQVPMARREGILADIMALWQHAVREPSSEVVLTVRREDNGVFVGFYDDAPTGGDLPKDSEAAQVSYEREGGHNLLELHWLLEPSDDPEALEAGLDAEEEED